VPPSRSPIRSGSGAAPSRGSANQTSTPTTTLSTPSTMLTSCQPPRVASGSGASRPTAPPRAVPEMYSALARPCASSRTASRRYASATAGSTASARPPAARRARKASHVGANAHATERMPAITSDPLIADTRPMRSDSGADSSRPSSMAAVVAEIVSPLAPASTPNDAAIAGSNGCGK